MKLLHEEELIYREMIYRLFHMKGNRSVVADSLGISVRTLRFRLNKLCFPSGKTHKEQKKALELITREYNRIYGNVPKSN